MSAEPFYSESRSEAEAGLGFVTAIVPNPHAQYFGAASLVKAIVCPIQPGVRVVKMYSPDTTVYYTCQQFGKLTDYAIPKWSVAIPGSTDPASAVADAKAGNFKNTLIAASPQIEIVCPSCKKEFSVVEGYLMFDGESECPHCKTTTPNEHWVVSAE